MLVRCTLHPSTFVPDCAYCVAQLRTTKVLNVSAKGQILYAIAVEGWDGSKWKPLGFEYCYAINAGHALFTWNANKQPRTRANSVAPSIGWFAFDDNARHCAASQFDRQERVIVHA